jgi:hypothetical protein
LGIFLLKGEGNMYGSCDVGMSFFNGKKYSTISRGLERLLTDLLGTNDVKVVCRETISKNAFMPEKERFQIIIGQTSEDWEKILKEN